MFVLSFGYLVYLRPPGREIHLEPAVLIRQMDGIC